jgi:hypothetical protein
MTTEYLKAKCDPIPPQVGKSYRVIGYSISGAIYCIEKIENGLCYFKGYNRPKELALCKFYNF